MYALREPSETYGGEFAGKNDRLRVENTIFWEKTLKELRHSAVRPRAVSYGDPTDPEPLCIFENPAADTQAKAEIPLEWFQNRELQKIEHAICQSVQGAQVQHKMQR